MVLMFGISEQARAEARERWGSDGYKTSWRSSMVAGFVDGAEWAASLNPEPSRDVAALLADADALVAEWDLRGSWTADSPVGMVMQLARALRAQTPPNPEPSTDVREALADVDKALDNVADLDPDLAWTNAEVVEMLEDVRSLLLAGEVTPGTFRTERTVPAPAATLPPLPICPECKAGKHGNCDGTAWDDALDVLTSCGCQHTTTTQPDGGTR